MSGAPSSPHGPSQQGYGLFVVTHDDGTCELRPSSLWGQSGFVIFALGAAFLFYLAGTFAVHAGESIAFVGFAAVPLAVGVMISWQAMHYWRTRRVALVIDREGRITYGEREWCPAASVRTVRIEPDPQGERGDCRIVLELAGGRLVELPLPYFGAVSQREPARFVAGELARALRVELVESA